ncbi:hypothetical protein TC41_0621 [Alicyclobacillus acidocaldarius subsp. acidocaldarius Tc-4-1]|uniref:Uncharacterized protein n=1 Tax=Alicyclobacillus acidocaldarius (strain Tc-4-1) TaxID=1048834 RepID=F8IDB4_ALIAT|nr:hypothetical protein TC41_0621 [Alicyclobacillus acidocaldarius subsp. acidocaldarius Tc-4-1]
MRRKLRRGAIETMIFFLLQLVYPASFCWDFRCGPWRLA